MTDPDKAAHRSYHTPTPGTVSYRDAEEVDGDEGMMEIRMPIASTGTVRNDGDDPLSGAELRGMAQQVDTLTRGVFPEHGTSTAIDDGQYSQFEKLGYWADADIQRDAGTDSTDLLVATARMPDPETLPAATGKYREVLAIIKEQAKRGIPIASSIGWRDDSDKPGGVDLMEASFVGIQADWQTVTAGGTEALARAAVEAGADPDDLVAEVERIVRADADPEDARPFGPPGDPNRWDTFEECTAEVEDWDGVDDPEAYCGWAKAKTEDQNAQSTDMTDDDTADDGGTTDEQSADDGETTERAPDDVGANELLTFVAMHLDGMDESDLSEAIDAADASYVGEVDVEALADLASTVTGAEYEAVMDAMSDLMDREMDDDEEDDEEEEEETQGDGYEDEEDDEDDERGADVPDDSEDASDDPDAETRELLDRLDALESELEAVREGDTPIQTPQQEAAEEQSADTEDEPEESAEETRDTDEGVFGGLGEFTAAER